MKGIKRVTRGRNITLIRSMNTASQKGRYFFRNVGPKRKKRWASLCNGKSRYFCEGNSLRS